MFFIFNSHGLTCGDSKLYRRCSYISLTMFDVSKGQGHFYLGNKIKMILMINMIIMKIKIFIMVTVITNIDNAYETHCGIIKSI